MANELKRQRELDYTKTLAIFMMCIIHVFEELSIYNMETSLPSGFAENLIQFAAGPLGAPMFIFATGVGMVFSRNQEPGKIFQRGVSLFLLGVLLNICRDVIPRLIVWFISGTFQGWEEYHYQLFNVDVLHFAGLAFILTALFRKKGLPPLAVLPIAVAMQAVGNWLSLVTEPKGIWEVLLSFFYYTGDLSCFSLLPWYLSLAIGVVCGTLMQTYADDPDKLHRGFFLTSFCCLLGLLCACYFNNVDVRVFYALHENLLYRQTFFNFLYNIFNILLLLSAVHFIIKKVPMGYSFFNYCGTNLTKIYIIQWMIIGWMTSFQGYLHIEPNFNESILLGIGIALVSMGISKLLPALKL